MKPGSGEKDESRNPNPMKTRRTMTAPIALFGAEEDQLEQPQTEMGGDANGGSSSAAMEIDMASAPPATGRAKATNGEGGAAAPPTNLMGTRHAEATSGEASAAAAPQMAAGATKESSANSAGASVTGQTKAKGGRARKKSGWKSEKRIKVWKSNDRITHHLPPRPTLKPTPHTMRPSTSK